MRKTIAEEKREREREREMEEEKTGKKRKIFTTEDASTMPHDTKLIIPDLPSNAKIVVTQRSFTAEQINDIDPAERSMIMQIVTFCCHTITKSCRQVSVIVDDTSVMVGDYEFKCFEIRAKFPIDVNFKKIHLDRLQQINATFIRDLRTIREPDSNTLALNVYSTKNKFVIKDIFITHIHQEHIFINTYENDIEDGRGGAKKPRASSVSSSSS